MVGVNPKKVDGKKDRWFMEHSWTMSRERLFTYLVATYLYVSPGARRELTSFWFKTWKRCLNAGQEWAWTYGWRHETREERDRKLDLYRMVVIIILFVACMVSIPFAIKWEDRQEIPQYDAVWRGHYNPENQD
jgi:hypothetical protein